MGGDNGRAGPLDQSRRRHREEGAAAGIVTFRLDLNRCEQQNAANGKGGDNIEKRSHGFSPYSNANQTSLFLGNFQVSDGRLGNKFQLKTETKMLHVLQLGSL
jgi:hypothetical protein